MIVDLERERSVTHCPLSSRYHTVDLSYRDPVSPVVVYRPLIGGSCGDDAPRAESESDAVECGTEIGRGGRSGSGGGLVHVRSLFRVSVPFVGDLFDFENLLPEMILALGLALLVGNGLAWWKHRKGESPKDVPDAAYRPGRVGFLMIVGLLLAVWGAVTLFT